MQDRSCLRPTPQLKATPDPWPAEQGQGSNPQPCGSWLDSLTTAPRQELPVISLNAENLLWLVSEGKVRDVKLENDSSWLLDEAT